MSSVRDYNFQNSSYITVHNPSNAALLRYQNQATSQKAKHFLSLSYFEFVSVKDAKIIVVRCKLCAGSKKLSTAKNTTSNLSKHLIPQRCDMKLVKNNAGADSGASTASDAYTPAKQQTLDFRAGHGGEKFSGQDLKKLIAGCIVEEMLAISTVDSPSF